RRVARLQFLPLSACLHRTLFDRHALARFPRARAVERIGRVPDARSALRDALRPRLWTAIVVLPAVLAATIFLPNDGFSVFIAIVGAWGLYEVAAMTSTSATAILAILVAGAAPLVLLLMLGDVAGWPLPAAVILNMLLLVSLVAVGGGAPGGTSLIISGALWVGVLFPYLAMLRNLPGGVAGIILMLLVVVASDSGAYFGGRMFGRIKLAPRVSPNKTVEGAISGL